MNADEDCAGQEPILFQRVRRAYDRYQNSSATPTQTLATSHATAESASALPVAAIPRACIPPSRYMSIATAAAMTTPARAPFFAESVVRPITAVIDLVMLSSSRHSKVSIH